MEPSLRYFPTKCLDLVESKGTYFCKDYKCTARRPWEPISSRLRKYAGQATRECATDSFSPWKLVRCWLQCKRALVSSTTRLPVRNSERPVQSCSQRFRSRRQLRIDAHEDTGTSPRRKWMLHFSYFSSNCCRCP
jgi:hypothetical protein